MLVKRWKKNVGECRNEEEKERVREKNIKSVEEERRLGRKKAYVKRETGVGEWRFVKI